MRKMLGSTVWFALALLVSACAGQVRPNAEQLAAKLQINPTSIDRKFLLKRGYVETESLAGPVLAAGRCYEKSRGHPLFGGMAGVDVVRVCIGDKPMQAFVFSMHTHGERWTEVYPNSTRSNGPTGDFRFNVSDETRKRLKR
jgi:hypothetical protein